MSVLARRAALRALPNLADFSSIIVKDSSTLTFKNIELSTYKNIFLPLFRAFRASLSADKNIIGFENKILIHSSIMATIPKIEKEDFSSGLSAILSVAASIEPTDGASILDAATSAISHSIDSIGFSIAKDFSGSDIEKISYARAKAWATIEAEAEFLQKYGDIGLLVAQDLWLDAPIDCVGQNWNRLKTHLLTLKDEDWSVWIDWYEAQLASETPNLALEEDILLISENTWNAGPKIANAEIRRLMQVHSREAQETLISPDVGIDKDGKATLVTNAESDVPDNLSAILDLPERLRDAIDDLLEMLAAKGNACPMVTPPLIRYRKHLDRYGPHPMLGSLNDRHAIVKDEYNSLRKDKFFVSEGGLRRAFLNFFGLHRDLRYHFAKDPLREQAIRTYRFDRDALDTADVKESIDAVEQGAKDMEAAEAAAPELPEYITELSEAMRLALDTPASGPPVEIIPDDKLTDPVPQEKLWPVRILMKGGSLAIRLYKFLNNPAGFIGSAASIAGFLDSDRGKKFMKALRDLFEAIFGSDEDP